MFCASEGFARDPSNSIPPDPQAATTVAWALRSPFQSRSPSRCKKLPVYMRMGGVATIATAVLFSAVVNYGQLSLSEIANEY